ncbi:MAG: ABC transporter permease [Desulfomonile tiedjei]|uniref:ABC transporter permease n=1 Tax=Desulfomonile tiedjei TaxID=2358 RepID=A0A9D6UYA1_9BACT|nr:ABC transporter permease [Desulfomonile tiedjei]
MSFLFDSLHEALRLVFRFDPEVYYVVWTSLKVSAASTVFASVVGVPLGLLIALTGFRGKSAVQLTLNTLMALPTVVVGLFFYAMLSRRGPLGDMGLLFTPSAIVVGLFVLGLPTIVNLTISAVHALDKRLLLTCKLLGATPVQQAWKILHEGRFGILASVVVAFGRVISEVGIAMMLGGNIRGFTRTMTTAIALETSKGEFELGLALGLVLLAAAFFVNAMLFLIQRSKG